MINPYFIYVLSFLVVIIAYVLKWSSLFPDLGYSLLGFLLVSITVAFVIGKAFMKKNIITFNSVKDHKYLGWITFGILGGYCLEFLYFGNFPLLAIITKVPLSYKDFGIPTFHVILVTFNSFFAVYLFQVILSKVKSTKKMIVYFILNLIPSLLIINRGMLVMILMSCLFVYLIKYQKKITMKIVLSISVLLIIGMYLFGVAGNVRVNNTYHTNTSLTDNSLFLQIGGATDKFKHSRIPKEFFWSYIYVASPLANLQKTINHYEFKKDINLPDSLSFMVTQMFPDFISKRVVSSYEIDAPKSLQVAPELNVSTAFADPYVFLGWVGISLFTLFIFIFAFFYILLLKRLNSEFLIVGVAILNSVFLFNTFANMFAFTGLSFQLVYPLLFTLFSVKKLESNGVSGSNKVGNHLL